MTLLLLLQGLISEEDVILTFQQEAAVCSGHLSRLVEGILLQINLRNGLEAGEGVFLGQRLRNRGFNSELVLFLPHKSGLVLDDSILGSIVRDCVGLRLLLGKRDLREVGAVESLSLLLAAVEVEGALSGVRVVHDGVEGVQAHILPVLLDGLLLLLLRLGVLKQVLGARVVVLL